MRKRTKSATWDLDIFYRTNLPKLGYVVPVVGTLAIVVTLVHLETPPHPIAVAPSEALSTQAFADDSVDNDLPIPIDDDSVSDAA